MLDCARQKREIIRKESIKGWDGTGIKADKGADKSIVYEPDSVRPE